MNYPEDVTVAAELLKKAVPHLVKNKIPANPINYTLWYNYAANNIPALNKALDGVAAGKKGLTPEESQNLYFHYIISEHLEDHQNTLKGITQLATQLITHFNKSVQGSEEFDSNLGGSIDRLREANSLGQVSTIVDEVIKTSETIQAANTHFRENIQQANQEIINLRHELQQVEKHAYIDQLTQLYNRHSFDKQLDQLIQAESGADQVYLILVDLDFFKSFNDNYGHVIGDRVLQRMGELIQDFSPDNGFGARYGGEEFAIIISKSTLEQAVEVAELVRQKTQQLRVKVKNSDQVLNNITASFGIAQYIIDEGAESFIDRADQALYNAKHNGRNRVEVYSAPEAVEKRQINDG